ncbi:MAG: hypothetical protein ABIJ61_04295, partial [bacterium]
MVKFWSLTLVFCLLTGMAVADDQKSNSEIGDYLQANDLETYQLLREYTDYTLAGTGFDDFPLPDDVFNYSYRSPGRAFFYSLLVPGGGQFYSNSKTKAAIFVGVEALLWAGYFKFHSDGKTIEDEYTVYADQYWSPALYTNWLIEEIGIIDDTTSWTEGGRTVSFSHHLPEVKSQQYYEMIGKYDQFQYGWLDTDYRRGDSLSTYRNQYLVTRDESNSAFGKAKAAA